jgi:hypothetical protein
MSFARTYRRTLVNRLDGFINNTLNKVNAVNKPFKAIQKTEDYKKFQTIFKEGIKDQAQWVVDNLPHLFESAGVEDNLSPLDTIQIQKMKGQINRDMPTLGALVPELKVFQFLKQFFEWSTVQQYRRWGVLAKVNGTLDFKLTNTEYVNQLKQRAAYLLNQSSLDSTTTDQIIDTISQGRLDAMTNTEVASVLSDQFDEVSASRAEMITRTEAANAMGQANHATATENGAQTHSWVAAGSETCDECDGNVDDGEIPIDQEFSSGDLTEPAHPNCECYTEAGMIDLDSIDIWDGA